MDSITNIDRLVLLLRQRLAERSRAAPARPSDRKMASEPPSGMDAVHALAQLDAVDPRQLKRALIQSLLTEALGKNLVNEAKFQQIVDSVTDTIDNSEESAPLLEEALKQLRSSVR